MPAQNMAQRPYDGLLDVWSAAYSIIGAIIRNGHAAAVTITKDNLTFLPVVFASAKAVLTPAANANTYNAIILEADAGVTALAAATDSAVKCTVLVRGPAVVQEQKIKLLDAAGAAITLATARTALQTLPTPPIIVAPAATNYLTAPA